MSPDIYTIRLEARISDLLRQLESLRTKLAWADKTAEELRLENLSLRQALGRAEGKG